MQTPPKALCHGGITQSKIKMPKLNVVRKGTVIVYKPKTQHCPPTTEMWRRHNALIESRRQAVISFQQHQVNQPAPRNGVGLGLVALLGLLLHV